MITIKIKKYYQSESELNDLHFSLKLIKCPHCKLIGFLIKHGFLYGYDEHTNKYGIIRGRRIFCSNRNKRKGCGRTISIFKSFIIKSFTFTTNTLWDLLNNIIKGFNISNTFKLLDIKTSISTPYRLFARFKHRQPDLRTALSRIKTKPPDSEYNKPVMQTIQHFASAFKNSNCPISAFQYITQTSIL